MADRIQQRRDTRARWEEFNPLLLEGEVGYVTDDPNLYKIGDGINRWNSLPYRGFDGTITQETGNSENAVMSQKAVSEKLSELGSILNESIEGSGYTNFEYSLIIGHTYVLKNTSNNDVTIDARNRENINSDLSLEDICNKLPKGAEFRFSVTKNGGAIGVRTLDGVSASFELYDEQTSLGKGLVLTYAEIQNINKQFIVNYSNGYLFKRNAYIENGALVDSASWETYIYKASDIERVENIIAYTNNTTFYVLAAYSDSELTNFLGGTQFPMYGRNETNYIPTPVNAEYIAISTRVASSSEFIFDVRLRHITSRLLNTEKTIENLQSDTLEHFVISAKSAFEKAEAIYISKNNEKKSSPSWITRIYDATKFLKIERAKLYCSTDTSIYAISFYKDNELAEFVSGIVFYKDGEHTFENISIPEEAKFIAISNRFITSLDFELDVMLKNVAEYIQNKTNKEDRSSRGLKRIYKNVRNHNDFTFVGDELWMAELPYDGTEKCTIIRHIMNDNGDIFPFAQITASDWGHINSIDYNPQNDCLIFGNGANAETTEGNFFAIVKNPLSIHNSASLAANALVINVDVGFKVQATWGDENLGENNVVILMSNGAKTITKLLLDKDDNGEFTGTYKILKQVSLEDKLGINGVDYFGDTLYFGLGSYYQLGCMSMTNYSTRIMQKHFYLNGEEVIGTIQGVYVDDKYMWLFINTDIGVNYLLQYYK